MSLVASMYLSCGFPCLLGTSPSRKRQHHPCLYARVPTGNYAGITAPNIMQGWQKEKGDQCPPTSPPTPPQAFGGQKAIAH